MSESLSKLAFKILRDDGIKELCTRSIKFVFYQCMDAVYSVDNNEIRKIADSCIKIEPSESITITYDGGSESTIPELLDRMRKRVTISPRYILEFEDAKIFGQPSFINVDNKWTRFYPTSAGNSLTTFSSSNHPVKDLIPSSPPLDKQLESGFVIGGARHGFAHWTYEQLPKLYWYEKYCAQTSSSPELVVLGELSEYRRRSLNLIGYTQDDYVQHQGQGALDFHRLLLPPHPRRTRNAEFQLCPSAIRWVKKKILSNISSGSREFSSRIYVSRADAGRRQVVNEKQVASLLNKYEFESYEPGRLPFDDQVRLFSNADIIVGPHGAGLANMIYADDAKVLELMTKISGEHYFVLANECSHTYEFLQCQPVDGNDIKSRYSDMYVDLTELENRLNIILDR